MEITFVGKRALVTGAGKGIGRELVKRLAGAGAKVVAISRTKADLDSLQKEVSDVETICVDVGDWEATKRVVEEVGPLDLLVNNAGILLMGPFGDITETDFDRLMAINLKAVLNISQVVANGMKGRGKGGAIVNVSSAVTIKGFTNGSLYCASKAALDQMTRVMAVELAPHNIRVNCVNPTLVRTPMAQIFVKTEAEKEDFIRKIPLYRQCETSDIVDAIVYLLSERASMVHGTALFVDGGLTCT